MKSLNEQPDPSGTVAERIRRRLVTGRCRHFFGLRIRTFFAVTTMNLLLGANGCGDYGPC